MLDAVVAGVVEGGRWCRCRVCRRRRRRRHRFHRCRRLRSETVVLQAACLVQARYHHSSHPLEGTQEEKETPRAATTPCVLGWNVAGAREVFRAVR